MHYTKLLITLTFEAHSIVSLYYSKYTMLDLLISELKNNVIKPIVDDVCVRLSDPRNSGAQLAPGYSTWIFVFPSLILYFKGFY